MPLLEREAESNRCDQLQRLGCRFQNLREHHNKQQSTFLSNYDAINAKHSQETQQLRQQFINNSNATSGSKAKSTKSGGGGRANKRGANSAAANATNGHNGVANGPSGSVDVDGHGPKANKLPKLTPKTQTSASSSPAATPLANGFLATSSSPSSCNVDFKNHINVDIKPNCPSLLSSVPNGAFPATPGRQGPLSSSSISSTSTPNGMVDVKREVDSRDPFDGIDTDQIPDFLHVANSNFFANESFGEQFNGCDLDAIFANITADITVADLADFSMNHELPSYQQSTNFNGIGMHAKPQQALPNNSLPNQMVSPPHPSSQISNQMYQQHQMQQNGVGGPMMSHLPQQQQQQQAHPPQSYRPQLQPNMSYGQSVDIQSNHVNGMQQMQSQAMAGHINSKPVYAQPPQGQGHHPQSQQQQPQHAPPNQQLMMNRNQVTNMQQMQQSQHLQQQQVQSMQQSHPHPQFNMQQRPHLRATGMHAQQQQQLPHLHHQQQQQQQQLHSQQQPSPHHHPQQQQSPMSNMGQMRSPGVGGGYPVNPQQQQMQQHAMASQVQVPQQVGPGPATHSQWASGGPMMNHVRHQQPMSQQHQQSVAMNGVGPNGGGMASMSQQQQQVVSQSSMPCPMQLQQAGNPVQAQMPAALLLRQLSTSGVASSGPHGGHPISTQQQQQNQVPPPPHVAHHVVGYPQGYS